MLCCVANNINEPVNLGSGKRASIKNVAEAIADYLDKEIVWDTSKPSGDAVRLMDTNRAESYGIKSKIDLVDGIRGTIDWYKDNNRISKSRYNSFTEQELLPNFI